MGENFFLTPLSEKIFRILRKSGIARFLLELIYPVYGFVNGYNPADFRIYAVGESHLDTEWNWTWYWTRKKITKTFCNALKNIREFPGFTFAASAPAHYSYFEERWPLKFRLLKKFVRAGRWCPVGGMWVEPDANVPSGESLVRQRLYGQKYYLEKFGRYSSVGWLPDTFGFTNMLPQILAKSGSRYFYTTKITWNDTNRFPFSIFYWQSPDGSRVLAVNFKKGFRGLESLAVWKKTARLLKKAGDDFTFDYSTPAEEYKKRLSDDYVREVEIPYGKGDGGGGPLYHEILIPYLFRLTHRWILSCPEKYMEDVRKKYGDRIPVWNDELYLEYHRGCPTTFYRVKKANRFFELWLPKMEKLLIFSAPFVGGYIPGKFEIFPTERFDKLWKRLLFNQFHDILPGSSIEEVYIIADRDYTEMAEELAEIGSEVGLSIDIGRKNPDTAARGSGTGGNNAVNGDKQPENAILFFPHHFSGSTVVHYPNRWNFGINSPFVTEKFPFDRFKTVYAPGGIGFRRTDNETEAKNSLPDDFGPITVLKKDTVISVEHGRMRAELDINDGAIHALYITEDGFAFNFASEGGDGLNTLCLFKDEPKSDDAWNIMKNYREYRLAGVRIEKITVNGSNMDDVGEIKADRVLITFDFAIGTSDGKLTYIFDRYLPEIIVHLDIDYREKRKLLRTEFDTALQPEYVYTGTAYGVIKRRATPKTPMEKARWEFPGQKFISISDGRLGLSILCADRYGFNCNGGKFGMSLLKAPLYGNPDGFMFVNDPEKVSKIESEGGETAIPPDRRKSHKDLGRHEIVWFIYPHKGDWKDAGVYRRYYLLVDGPAVLEGNGVPDLPSESFVKLLDCDAENVLISVVKPPYGGGDGLIIRLCELYGRKTRFTLFISPLLIGEGSPNEVRVITTDLLEDPLSGNGYPETYRIRNGLLDLEIGPFSIMTLKFEFDGKPTG